MTDKKELAERLEHAIVTATNDDLTEPMTEKRIRHTSRLEVMREAVAALRAPANIGDECTRPSEEKLVQAIEAEIKKPNLMFLTQRIARAVLALLTTAQPGDGITARPGDGWMHKVIETASEGLESAAATAQPRDGWQPIETAPKDGTMILAFNEAHGDMAVVGWSADEDGGCWTDVGNQNRANAIAINGRYFQKWRPLPAPPSNAGGERT